MTKLKSINMDSTSEETEIKTNLTFEDLLKHAQNMQQQIKDTHKTFQISSLAVFQDKEKMAKSDDSAQPQITLSKNL